MFKIHDGRDVLYQWDSNVAIEVTDETVTQVHFCNRTDDCALTVEVYEKDGARLANIPNILLQESWDIRAYAYCSCFTKVEKRFKVVARSKPADYIYTETEVVTVADAVAIAIEEAIASGEFKGDKGDPGEPGEPGKDGAPGKDGESGVYVGATAPTDDSLIWIDPNGEASGAGVTMEEVEAYVDEAIANIDIPESSGGGMQVFVFEHYTLATLTDEEKEMAAYLYNTVKNTGKVPADYIFYFKANDHDYILNKIKFNSSNNRLYINIRESAETNHQYVILADDTGACTEFVRYRNYNKLGGEEWTRTNNLSDSGLYNARQINIQAYEFNNDYVITSYIVFNDFLGAYPTSYKYMFTTPEGMDGATPYWQYDGSSISIVSNSDYQYTNVYIAYKTGD